MRVLDGEQFLVRIFLGESDTGITGSVPDLYGPWTGQKGRSSVA